MINESVRENTRLTQHHSIKKAWKGKNMEKDLSQLDKEIERRIVEMECKDYKFAQRFSKKDYIITAVVVVACLIAVIAGAFIK